MEEKRFAVLIDADNNSKDYIKTVIDEITKEGVITYKRMYGDWTSPALKSMKEALLAYSITPMQQYAYTKGKNSTDSAMIIDAMDILYSGKVEGFCLVSSDSDFTKLASRLREAGMIVIGMGRQQTPKPFVAACNKFKFVDLIGGEQKERTESKTKPVSRKQKAASAGENAETPLNEIKQAISDMIEENANDEGWTLVSIVGSLLQKKYSEFDARNYGYRRLVELLKGLKFEIMNVQDPNNKSNPTGYVVYVRERREKNA